MATITDDDFEGSYPPAGYTESDVSNHLGISALQAHSGSNSLRVNSAASGAVAYMFDTVAGKVFVVRFYFRIAQAVSATSDIYTVTNAQGNVYIRMLTTNVIRLNFNGATSYDGPTLSLNQWYRIDARFDSTGASIVVDWQVDGSAQTQRSRAQTSANDTALTIGIDTTATADLYFDDLMVTDTSGDYPLGWFVDATAENTAGTGAANNAGKTLKPNAGNSAGTGAAANMGGTASASIGGAAGTGAANNAVGVPAISAAAGNAAGTGAAAAAKNTLGPSPAQSAGTGTASNASETLATNATASSGTGAAAGPGGTVSASINASAGTGTAYNATGTQAKIVSAELASGTGSAAHLISSALIANIGSAAGTSTAQNAEADADSGALPGVATAIGAAYLAAVTLSPNAQAALGAETSTSIVTDTFTRTASSSLGTADSGQVWTLGGTASAFNVGSGEATFAHTASNQSRRAWLPAVVAHDVDQTFKFKVPATSGSDHHIFIRLRQNAGVDGDALMPKVLISGTTMTLSIVRRAVAVETELASTILGFSFEADTYYTIRSRVLGQGIFARVWKTSLSEPTNWQLWATDTQLAAPGGVGVATHSPPGATYPFSFTWDDLATNELTGSQAYNATVFITPEVNAIASAALGTGAVGDTVGTISLPALTATATGDGYIPTFDYQSNVDVASGTGLANDISTATVAFAEAASALGAAWGQSSIVNLGIDVAEGIGMAFDKSAVGDALLAAGLGLAYDPAIDAVSSFAGFGILTFSSASGSLTYRSAGAALTIGGS